MKQCSWCGREYPDDATECAVDARPLEKIGGPKVPAHEAGQSVRDDRRLDGYSADGLNAKATKTMVVGGLWCGGGILVTFLTYAAASNSPAGGSYVVAWGAILFGGMQFYRGWRLSEECRQHFQRPAPLIELPDDEQLDNQIHSPTPRLAKTKWKCPVCGEECEPQFQSCWRCQTVRKDIAI